MSNTENTAPATATTTEAPAKSKQQLRDEFLRDQRAAKAAAKAAKKAETAAKRADGVIGTIRQMIDSATGATKTEIVAKLTEKFPTRDPLGMVVTVGIQLSRLAQSTGRKIENYKHETRGRVYGFADVLVRPAIVAEMPKAETPAPATTEAPTAPAEPAAKIVRRPGGAKPGRQ